MAQIRPIDSMHSRAMRGPLSPAAPRKAAATFGLAVVGVPRESRAATLLDRALTDAGLAAGAVCRSTALPSSVPGWQMIVALGAETASALLRRPINLAIERGRILATPDGHRLLVTEHPAAILRLVDGVARGREYRRLVSDLLQVVPFQRRAA